MLGRALSGVLITALFVSTSSALAFVQSVPAADTSKNDIGDVNAARIATKEKRYADSEALMLKVTIAKPELIIPRIELGLAQLGLKKYSEAENTFKTAIGIDPPSLQRAHSDDFYQQAEGPNVVAATATRLSRNTVTTAVNSGKQRPPEVLGTGYASLGEIYIHQGKVAEAQAAFDKAVEANPPEAALYLGNETIFFFQAGNSDAQLAAAERAIAVDPNRAMPYYFKAQALTSKATLDPKTQKLILPEGCAEAYRKYLALDPNGQFSADAKGVLAGVS